MKTVTGSSSPSTAKRISAPSERPIQLRCIVLTRSDQCGSASRPASRRSAYSVIRKNHCVRSRISTASPERSQRPSTTCSLASTVRQPGHQFTGACLRYGEPLLPHPQEEPLVPPVVGGIAGGELLGPVVEQAERPQLLLHPRDVRRACTRAAACRSRSPRSRRAGRRRPSPSGSRPAGPPSAPAGRGRRRGCSCARARRGGGCADGYGKHVQHVELVSRRRRCPRRPRRVSSQRRCHFASIAAWSYRLGHGTAQSYRKPRREAERRRSSGATVRRAPDALGRSRSVDGPAATDAYDSPPD